jgi:hypothetical protein
MRTQWWRRGLPHTMLDVSRVLVLWGRPQHLTAGEAERWARGEVRALLASGDVRSAELTRLESASPRHGSDWSWLLELEIDVPVRECIEHGACAEWLGDLRMLGMRPAVMVAAERIELEDE